MERATDGPRPTPSDLPRETAGPRQRWRLVVARAEDAPRLGQRETAEAWEAALVAAGLPVARSESASPRPRVSFGAALPVGMAAEGDLIDVVLTERLPVWRVRESLDGRVPTGWTVIDLHDVWLAGPPLAGRVAAADYRVDLGQPRTDRDDLDAACRQLLAERHVMRRRPKGDTTVEYDLRPLLINVDVIDGVHAIDSPTSTMAIRVRTRFHPELGTGRPEEVVASLGDRLGITLEPRSIVRERLVLADDLAR